MKNWVFLGVFMASIVGAFAGGWVSPVTLTTTNGTVVWTNKFQAVSLGALISVGPVGTVNTMTWSVVNGAVTSLVGSAAAVSGTARLDVDENKFRVYTSDKLIGVGLVTGPVSHVLHNFAGE